MVKYGIVEAFYYLASKNNSDRFLIERFNSLSKRIKKDFDNDVKHPFPIATSVEDLKSILDTVFKLHQDFISNFTTYNL